MKLNCDMGESFGSWSKGMDADVMPYIDMANIACGYHASDPQIMDLTVKLAQKSGVMVGAHPGYPDLVGFGRRDMVLTPDELRMMMIYQLSALDGICRVNGTKVQYVKPHGALYNRMMVDDGTLEVLIQAIADYSDNCPLVVMATPEAESIKKLAARYGVELWFEAFSDRAYDDHGRLVSRNLPGAVHRSKEAIEAQVLQIIEKGTVTTISGRQISINADTICIHGDSDHAVAAARHIREVIGA